MTKQTSLQDSGSKSGSAVSTDVSSTIQASIIEEFSTMQGDLCRQANVVSGSKKHQSKKAGSRKNQKRPMPLKATATASPTQSKELRYQEKKSAVVTARASTKFVATNEFVREIGSGYQELPTVSTFDCSENEEAYNESAGAEEESSGSTSQEFDSTHNTSTTSQEEAGAFDSQSNDDNSNGLKNDVDETDDHKI